MSPNILLQHTPLPETLINMICEYVNDELEFNLWYSIQLYKNEINKRIFFDSVNANINFENIEIQFHFFCVNDTNKYNFHTLNISENVIKCHSKTHSFLKMSLIYKIFKQIIDDKEPLKYITVNKIQFEIVNHELTIIICNMIVAIMDTFKQFIKEIVV